MKETRLIAGTQLRAMQGKAMRISGMAARYNVPTVIGNKNSKGSFREIIARGAFRNSLRSSDTALLLNHDPNKILGRVSAKTLQLRETDEGLAFEATLPDTTDGHDCYENIRAGNLNGCSFGFRMDYGDDDWDVETDERGKRMARRTIKNIAALDDVSVVVFPAYDGTSVHARSKNLSEVVIPKKFVVEATEAEAVEVIARRRALLNSIL